MPTLYTPKRACLLQFEAIVWWDPETSECQTRCHQEPTVNKLVTLFGPKCKFNLVRPQPRILIHPSALKEKPHVYKHSCLRPEKSFDQYTIAAFQRLQNGTSKTKTLSKWTPKVTVPQPFKMTLRYWKMLVQQQLLNLENNTPKPDQPTQNDFWIKFCEKRGKNSLQKCENIKKCNSPKKFIKPRNCLDSKPIQFPKPPIRLTCPPKLG